MFGFRTRGPRRAHRGGKYMKAEWKEIKKGDVVPGAAGLYASLNPKGNIVINLATHERMGSPEAVNLLFDAVNNRIGLKPTSAALRNAFRLHRHGRGLRRRVWALKLVREVGIAVRETIEFQNPEIDQDGILILDLRDTRVSARARAMNRRNRGPVSTTAVG